MNTPLTPTSKPRLHPLILAAAAAVVLVSSLGAAAIMGWLPSSAGKNSEIPLNANGQPMTNQTVQTPTTQANDPAYHRTTPVHHSRPEYIASASPTTCSECGVIDAVNEIDTRGQGSGVGAAGGAVVGGLLGNQVGGGRGRELATIAGAIGGAVAGNQVEGNVRSTHSYDISVRLNNGTFRTFHQSEQPAWHTGDHVRIVDGSIRSNG
ncbi:glycine zipper 2TM domain-containing protein [Rugamonas sp.]|uniref:glycine zipper 2TM domain-containing protein n=1 Tax=Rugamonas sp. TaxID=1926287 RepID=UPI0025DB7503|nr:glycine zipper 2TM domain-containing protein [Rugamonas sp.]